ncbi:DegT/DnrJ/EryC1/StrS family aminotransferase [Maledivibacter halophilus]|uniref:Perosamine synthetase n=1 Tax=Maledivibacter halophilus TaxID=36842 RepID=A0A1T5L1P5_9FIRM|nr:DegT/DnrJ/EryC1/StrS family aminotransferase [Maledivibacter halophilus]SKC69820.1 perosamine synthetase [Maledivibacter halophilus]
MGDVIQVASPVLNGNEKKYVNECLETTWISSKGKYVDEFENRFAEFCRSRYAISCSNGTVALHLALLAFNIGPGDEVLVPTLTYIATANAVTYCGGKPVFVDSDPETWNIDPNKIENKINSNTKGIIVVHLYGHPVDMDPIMKIAKKYNLFVIEDVAEAHGALYKDRVVGSIGDISTFSFFGNKIITTGEGGMVVTNNEKLNEKIRILRSQGMYTSRRYWFEVIGYNYRMTNIQAAIGLAQLENIQWHLDKRREIADLYYKYLGSLLEYIEFQAEKDWATHSYWMFSIILKNTVKISRDEFMEHLKNDKVETRPVFYPLHTMPTYRETKEKYPVAEKVGHKGINLPTHGLLKEEDIAYISERIKKYCEYESCDGD